MNLSQVFGLAGTAIVICAYLPQVLHLKRERCSGAISRKAYSLWLAASLLILIHAVLVRDLVFVLLQSSNAIATAMILLLAERYKDNVCTTHMRRFSSS